MRIGDFATGAKRGGLTLWLLASSRQRAHDRVCGGRGASRPGRSSSSVYEASSSLVPSLCLAGSAAVDGFYMRRLIISL